MRGSAHLLSFGEGKILKHICLLVVSPSKCTLPLYPLLELLFTNMEKEVFGPLLFI